MPDLHEAVARAIADVRYAPGKGGLVTAQADAAIGVVLAEAQRSIEALVNPDALDCGDTYNLSLTDVLAALAALGGEA